MSPPRGVDMRYLLFSLTLCVFGCDKGGPAPPPKTSTEPSSRPPIEEQPQRPPAISGVPSEKSQKRPETTDPRRKPIIESNGGEFGLAPPPRSPSYDLNLKLLDSELPQLRKRG